MDSGVQARRALSLIELVVVIAILSVVVGIIVPVLASGKRAAEGVLGLSDIRSLGFALRSYMDTENRGILRICRSGHPARRLYAHHPHAREAPGHPRAQSAR